MFDPSFDLTDVSPATRARFERIMRAGGIRGGDGSGETTALQDLLAQAGDVTELSDEDLEALLAMLVEAGMALVADPSQATDETIAQAREVEAAVKALRTTQGERAEAATERAAQAAEIAAALAGEGEGDGEPGEGEGEDEGAGGEGDGGEGGEGDGAGEGDAGEGEPGEGDGAGEGEGEGEGAPTAIAAGKGGKPVVSRVAARRPASMKPRVAAAREFKLTASANAPGVPAGAELDTPERIMNCVEQALRAAGTTHTGAPQRVPLFSLGAFDAREIYGEERYLTRDAQGNEGKIQAVTSMRALRATGGICAPAPQRYDLPVIGITDRPVRGAFANFGVPRGGIRLLPPPTLTDVSAAVSVWTQANDIDPGSDGNVTKPFATLNCPSEVETLVDAIVKQLKIGNYRNMFFPEQVEAWVKLAAVVQARFAESRLLDKLGAQSTQVEVSQVLGTTRTVLAAMDRAGAALRSHFRVDPDAPLRFLGPAWLLDNMITDLSREHPGSTAERLATSDAEIQAWFSGRQINASWFLDGENGSDQVFPLQGAGELTGWPSKAICYLYVEGSWLFLDGGTLDFGIVRDSTLNGTNDFMMFSEDFEQSAFHGTPGTSLRLDIDICPSGETAAAVDTSGLCTSGS